MYWLEIQDIMLLIRNLKDTSDANDLKKYIKFVNNRTRANGVKLEHKFARLTTTRNFFFSFSSALECTPKEFFGSRVIVEHKQNTPYKIPVETFYGELTNNAGAYPSQVKSAEL